MRPRATAALVAAGAALLAGCGGSSDSNSKSSSSDASELRVSAASSLKQAFSSCAPKAKFSFAGSDELAAQIRQGAKPDVFAAANTKLPDALHAAGRLSAPVVFAGNRLVIAVKKGSPIASIDDVAKPGVKLVVGQASVPVGDYTRKVLSKYPDRAAVEANVKSKEPDVGAVTAKLTQGAADAGFVYYTDVVGTKGELEAVELPASLKPKAKYGLGIVKGAPHRSAATAFVASVRTGACRDALRSGGFALPAG